MPCLKGRYEPYLGPIINVGVLPSGSSDPANLSPHTVPALLDTGAQITCISPRVVEALQLTPLGLRQVRSATGIVPLNTYLIDLVLPLGPQGLFRSGMLVVGFAVDHQNAVQMLIGRDLISRSTLILRPNGDFTFCMARPGE